MGASLDRLVNMISMAFQRVKLVKHSLRRRGDVKSLSHVVMIYGVSKITCLTQVGFGWLHVLIYFLQVWKGHHGRSFGLFPMHMPLVPDLVSAEHKA